MTTPDDDHDVVYREWIESRRRPPAAPLHESVLDWVSSEEPYNSTTDIRVAGEPSLQRTLQALLLHAAQTLAVVAAVAVCVIRVCLVIFPFSELH